MAEVLVDANLAAESFGEAGATISSGPKVGPNTLSEILCTGQVRVIVTDGTRPLAHSDLARTPPPTGDDSSDQEQPPGLPEPVLPRRS